MNIKEYEMWRDMIRSDQMSHKEVVVFLSDHKDFAEWLKINE